MPEVTTRGNNVADRLFNFFRLREALLLSTRPNQLVANMHVKNPARIVGYQGDGTEFILKGAKQLLCEPTCPQ